MGRVMTDLWNADSLTLAAEVPPALSQSEIDQRVFDLSDEYFTATAAWVGASSSGERGADGRRRPL